MMSDDETEQQAAEPEGEESKDERGHCLRGILLVARVLAAVAALAVILANVYVLMNLEHYVFKRENQIEFLAKAFYGMVRVYTIIFCLAIILSAAPPLGPMRYFFRYILVLESAFARGMLQVFVGVLSLESTLGKGNTEVDAVNFAADLVGYILAGLGLLHIILSFCCLGRKKEKEEGGLGRIDPPATSDGGVVI